MESHIKCFWKNLLWCQHMAQMFEVKTLVLSKTLSFIAITWNSDIYKCDESIADDCEIWMTSVA